MGLLCSVMKKVDNDDIIKFNNEKDIICGLGRRQYHNPGNLFYRDLMSKTQEIFLHSQTIKERRSLVQNIMRKLKNENRRLLSEDKNGNWIKLDDGKIYNKIYQAFRDYRRKVRDKDSISSQTFKVEKISKEDDDEPIGFGSEDGKNYSSSKQSHLQISTNQSFQKNLHGSPESSNTLTSLKRIPDSHEHNDNLTIQQMLTIDKKSSYEHDTIQNSFQKSIGAKRTQVNKEDSADHNSHSQFISESLKESSQTSPGSNYSISSEGIIDEYTCKDEIMTAEEAVKYLEK